MTEPVDAPAKDREERILDAVLSLLAQGGISAVSIRAVAREAGVALGLVNYYYADKVSLIASALRLGQTDCSDQGHVLTVPSGSAVGVVRQGLASMVRTCGARSRQSAG